MFHKLFGSLMIVLLLATCAPAAPPASISTPLDAKVDVGGYKLRIIRIYNDDTRTCLYLSPKAAE